MPKENPLDGMPVASVTFEEASDEHSGWPDLAAKFEAKQVIQTTSIKMLVRPDAMASGAPGLVFRFDFTDGTVLLANTSLRQLFKLIVPAIRGRLAFLGIDEDGNRTRPAKEDAN